MTEEPAHDQTAVKHSEQRNKTFAISGKSNTSKGLLYPLSKVNKIGRRAVAKGKNVAVSYKTRQQKIEAVIHSVELLVKDNNRLRLVCRYGIIMLSAYVHSFLVVMLQ